MMSLEIGRILLCKKRFDCKYVKGFSIEIGDTATIEQFDIDVYGLPKYLCIRKNNISINPHTWLQYEVSVNTIKDNMEHTKEHNIKYIWDYFESKQGRAKRIIHGFKNR